jgi:hypothetical protein
MIGRVERGVFTNWARRLRYVPKWLAKPNTEQEIDVFLHQNLISDAISAVEGDPDLKQLQAQPAVDPRQGSFFRTRPRLYFWQVIAMREPGEPEMHALKEIESWMQHGDELARGLGREPLSRQLRTRRAKSRFWRTR